jgi:hypothetical protein
LLAALDFAFATEAATRGHEESRPILPALYRSIQAPEYETVRPIQPTPNPVKRASNPVRQDGYGYLRLIAAYLLNHEMATGFRIGHVGNINYHATLEILA